MAQKKKLSKSVDDGSVWSWLKEAAASEEYDKAAKQGRKLTRETFYTEKPPNRLIPVLNLHQRRLSWKKWYFLCILMYLKA